MKQAYKVGLTQGKDVSMDFHVPTPLMLQIAIDCGFSVKNNKVVDIIGFMYYLNKNSQLPFLYKLRGVNQTYEFFIRLEAMYVHISTTDITMDDGERVGKLMDNYSIEMTATVRFPSPKYYAYYSLAVHDNIKIQGTDGSYNVYGLAMSKVPIVNEKGWNQFMTTEYIDDTTPKKDPIVIKFNDLIGDIRNIIDYTKSIYISPDIFIQIKLYNEFKEIGIKVNWLDYTITTDVPLTVQDSFIVFYVDLNYMNTQLVNLEGYNKNRLSKKI